MTADSTPPAEPGGAATATNTKPVQVAVSNSGSHAPPPGDGDVTMSLNVPDAPLGGAPESPGVVPPPADQDMSWTTMAHSRKRARADSIVGGHDLPQLRPTPRLALGNSVTSAAATVTGGRNNEARHGNLYGILSRTPTSRLLGRKTPGGGPAHPLGTARRLVMSVSAALSPTTIKSLTLPIWPLGDGQILEKTSAAVGTHGARPVERIDSTRSFATGATAGSMVPNTPATLRASTRGPGAEGPALGNQRNATPGPSNAAGINGGDGPGRALTSPVPPVQQQLASPFETPTARSRAHTPAILPPAPEQSNNQLQIVDVLPPLLCVQALNFLSRLPDRIRDNLIGAIDYGLVPLPKLVQNYPNDFWPEAVSWIQKNPWLILDDVPALADAVIPPNGRGDQVMEDVQDLDQAFDDQANHDLQLPQPVAPPVVDIQNLVFRPNAVPAGGRLTHKPFPLPRPHLHGVAAIQPPFDVVLTSEPDEGFLHIRHDDPEAPYAGWDVERLRFFAQQDPEHTVIAIVHLPKVIKAGEGWMVAKGVRDFLDQLCGPNDAFISPIEIQDLPPHPNPDDVHSRPPMTVGIGNLPVGIAPSLIQQQTFSSENISIHFLPNELRFDDFLGRIEGFAQGHPDDISTFVGNRFESAEVRAIISKYVARNLFRNMDPPEVATQNVIDSLRIVVDTLPSSQQPIVWLYIDSPTDSIDTYCTWRKEMRAVRWKSLKNGTGVLVYLPPCRGCISVEHRIAECPFPDIQGWLGPTHEEVSRQGGIWSAGRGRGFLVTGRGRGRPYFRG